MVREREKESTKRYICKRGLLCVCVGVSMNV